MDALICLIFFIYEDYVIFVDVFMQNCLISFYLGSFHLFIGCISLICIRCISLIYIGCISLILLFDEN